MEKPSLSDEEVRQTFRELLVGYELKKTLRYHSERDGDTHSESVAEHVCALLFLAQYFLPLEDSEGLLDREKVYRMILFHDFAEIVHGDLPYHLKTEEDVKRELEAGEQVFERLPREMQETSKALWREYEEKKSPEARFVNALDKIEPIFELAGPVNETSLKRLRFTYEDHIGKKLVATEGFPVMRRFVDVISADMLERDVFWKDSATPREE